MNINELKDFYFNKRILVTGHTGFKGTWLCKVLSMFGANVYGYSLNPSTTPNIYNILKGDEWMNSIIGDIRDFERLNKCIKSVNPEYVFHLAAQPIVRESYKIPRDTYETNVMGTVNILESIRNHSGIKGFLNVTTDKVYENNDKYDHPFCEDEKLDGFDPYSNSKSCSELVTHSYKKSFFSEKGSPAISTARAGNVIGGGDFSVDRIIPDCVRDTIKGNIISIRNPFSIRPYQHVLEPISVYLLIMMMQVKCSEYAGYYNVGPDDEACVNTGRLAELFVQHWGNQAKWESKKETNAPHEASFLKLDCQKLKNTFGWNPVWHIDEAVRASVEWYKAWNNNENCSLITEYQIAEFLSIFSEMV